MGMKIANGLCQKKQKGNHAVLDRLLVIVKALVYEANNHSNRDRLSKASFHQQLVTQLIAGGPHEPAQCGSIVN